MMERERGFTCIEVMVAAVSLSIIIFVVLGAFATVQDACSLASARLSIQTTSSDCVSNLERSISESRIFGIAVDGSWIRLQALVDHDDDGDVLDDNGSPEWGANGRLGWCVEYAYHTEGDDHADENGDHAGEGDDHAGEGDDHADEDHPDGHHTDHHHDNGEFDEEDEGDNGIDLNGDGDTDDEIEFGYIVKRLRDENGVVVTSRRMTPSCVILDLDGDGLRSPLFARVYSNGTDDPDGSGSQPRDSDGPNVRISFWSFRIADGKRAILSRTATVIATRKLWR